MKLFPPHAFLFKGGGGGSSTPQQVPPPPAPTLAMPAPAAPPVTSSAIEVTQARLDAKKQAKARKGLNSTILAGAGGESEGSTGGLLGGAGKGTLLGGG